MGNRAEIYPYEFGFVVIVHVRGTVWTRHYMHDLQAISDLHEVHLLGNDDITPFTGEFSLAEAFDPRPLADAGFHRSAEAVH